MVKTVKMFFEFKNTIPAPPMGNDDMREQTTRNDKPTVNAWRESWIKNAKSTHKRFGGFRDRGLGKLFNLYKNQPCILVGSGPSLQNNIERLAQVKGIPIVSCLHNYHYMVDNKIPVNYYVSLDAGAVVSEEISEGGKLTHEEYLESTKDKKLIAFIGSNPKLFEQWQGEVILFNCPVPDDQYKKEVSELEPFYTFVSTGGNVLGASAYIAKAIFGCNPLIFVGADFSFSYDRKFHAWDSKYDADIGEALRCVDIYGNCVMTWQSYYNFKIWFDWLSMNVPGIYINCSEGGLLGSYPEGNIQSIQQMKLDDCLWMYEMSEQMRKQCENPTEDDKKVLF